MGEYSRGKCKIGNRRNTQVNPRNTNRNMPKHHGKWQETVRKPGERTIERIIMIITGGGARGVGGGTKQRGSYNASCI